MLPKIVVIMSSFNGEQYLKEQLKSITSQNDVDLSLVVRDDGSKDKTKAILDEMGINYLEGENIGVGNSFMEALYHIDDEYDYYAFADQDDVWKPNKLSNAISMLADISGPALYCSNQYVTDEHLNILAVRYEQAPDISVENVFNRNPFSGCTMVWNLEMNRILKNDINRPSKELLQVRIHDVWLAVVATAFGKLIYDKNAYIYYRQHNNNVVGAYKEKKAEQLKNVLKKIYNRKLRNPRSRLAYELVKMQNNLNKNTLPESVLVASQYPSVKSKVKIIKKIKDYTRYTGENSFIFISKVIFNLF